VRLVTPSAKRSARRGSKEAVSESQTRLGGSNSGREWRLEMEKDLVAGLGSEVGSVM
jgi:hypothetical protein